MLVSDAMTKNPACCRATATLRDVANLMKKNDCGCIPVCEDGQRPIGIITDRDICLDVVALGKDPAKVTAFEVMHAPVRTVRAPCWE